LAVGPGAAANWTLAELLTWWLQMYSRGRPCHRTNEGAIGHHLIASDIGTLTVSDVTSRAEVDRLAFGIAPLTDDRFRRIVGALSQELLLPPLLPEADPKVLLPPHLIAIPEAFRAYAAERDTGLEPATFSLGTRCGGIGRGGRWWLAVASE